MNRRFAAIIATPVLALGTAFVLASPAVAAADKDCADFQYQEDAQAYLNAHPGEPDGLDRDNDGVACETLPSRPQAPGGGGPGPRPGTSATACPTPTPSAYPSPTATPKPEPTETASPEPTEEPEPTESSEPTESPEPTETPEPPMEEKKNKLAEVPAVSPSVEPIELPTIEEPAVTPSEPSAGEGGGVPVLCAPSATPTVIGGAGDGLPVTGASLTTVLAGGLLTLLAGIGAVFFSRRRKSLA